jgi:hypothetical protein
MQNAVTNETVLCSLVNIRSNRHKLCVLLDDVDDSVISLHRYAEWGGIATDSQEIGRRCTQANIRPIEFKY